MHINFLGLLYKRLGGFNRRNLSPHGSGGQESQTKMSAGLLFLLRPGKEDLFLPPLLASEGFWQTLTSLDLYMITPNLYLHYYMAFSLCVCLYVQVSSSFFFFLKTQLYWIRAHPDNFHGNLIIYKDHVFKWGHGYRHWKFGLHHLLGGHDSTHKT